MTRGGRFAGAGSSSRIFIQSATCAGRSLSVSDLYARQLARPTARHERHATDVQDHIVIPRRLHRSRSASLKIEREASGPIGA